MVCTSPISRHYQVIKGMPDFLNLIVLIVDPRLEPRTFSLRIYTERTAGRAAVG